MKYNHICSRCGAEFSRDNDKAKQCPHCESIWILISYYDGDIGINIKEYEQIKVNAEFGHKVKLQCPDCSNTIESFGHIEGTFCCECGGMPLKLVIEKQQELLKKYRKKNKLSQKLMAWKLNISQNYYSDIERGKRPIPAEITQWINKNIAVN
ncbi:helix-turn-helix domain-containing protein [Sporomusa aerivorans]|uniref:helix-turn-helix domain-containing protein n=1 Tax=Sporomusa aerivorans TaxID=204936 RepID=UPI003529F1AC